MSVESKGIISIIAPLATQMRMGGRIIIATAIILEIAFYHNSQVLIMVLHSVRIA